MPSRTVVSRASGPGTGPSLSSALIRGSARPNAAPAAASSASSSGVRRHLDFAAAYPASLAPILRANAAGPADHRRMLRRLLVRQALQIHHSVQMTELRILRLACHDASAARARMRVARRSRVFGSRAGTAPSRPPDARLQPPETPNAANARDSGTGLPPTKTHMIGLCPFTPDHETDSGRWPPRRPRSVASWCFPAGSRMMFGGSGRSGRSFFGDKVPDTKWDAPT